MTSLNIFMTGSSGKVGAFLARELLSSGHRLTLLSRKAICHPGAKCVQGDLTDPETYASAVKSADAVIHAGGLTHTNDEDKYFRVNAQATLDLLKICRDAGVKRFIFISTRAISPDGGAYSRSKATAEEYVKNSGIGWTILRLSEVYGVSGKEGVDMLIKSARALPVIPVVGSGEYRLAPVHIKDAVKSVAAVLENPDSAGKIYNIAGPASCTYNELVDMILTRQGIKRLKLHVPLWAVRMFLRALSVINKNSSMVTDQLPRLVSEKSDDISLARAELGFDPVNIKDAAGVDG